MMSRVWLDAAVCHRHSLAFYQELLADAIYVLVALWWLIPDRRIEHAVGTPRHRRRLWALFFTNPACSKSRETLAIIRSAGIEPDIITYLDQPPSRETCWICSPGCRFLYPR